MKLTFKSSSLKKTHDFMVKLEKLGYVVADEIKWDNEPYFDKYGFLVEKVDVTDYHYNDSDGFYVGTLQVAVGDTITKASFLEYGKFEEF